MAALDLPENGEVPEWVHLLPTAKGAAQTRDMRGPYHVTDAAAIIAASFADQSKLQIDENHAEDLLANKGGSSPAHGWIIALEARADGIWGKVSWNPSGHAMLTNKSYRAMSPVILHDPEKNIISIERASLVNRPNFRGLATLNQETSMNGMDKIAEALGLAADVSADAIVTAITAMKGKDTAPALQSALTAIGVALGVEGDHSVVLAAAKLAGAGKDSNVALQAQVASQATKIASLEAVGARTVSETYVRGEIAKGRLIPTNAVEDMIALHMSQPDMAVKLIAGTLMGKALHLSALPPAADETMTALSAEQQGVEIANRAKAYQSEQAKIGFTVDFQTAVMHISEKKK